MVVFLKHFYATVSEGNLSQSRSSPFSPVALTAESWEGVISRAQDIA